MTLGWIPDINCSLILFINIYWVSSTLHVTFISLRGRRYTAKNKVVEANKISFERSEIFPR